MPLQSGQFSHIMYVPLRRQHMEILSSNRHHAQGIKLVHLRMLRDFAVLPADLRDSDIWLLSCCSPCIHPQSPFVSIWASSLSYLLICSPTWGDLVFIAVPLRLKSITEPHPRERLTPPRPRAWVHTQAHLLHQAPLSPLLFLP